MESGVTFKLPYHIMVSLSIPYPYPHPLPFIQISCLLNKMMYTVPKECEFLSPYNLKVANSHNFPLHIFSHINV